MKLVVGAEISEQKQNAEPGLVGYSSLG